MEGKGKGVEEGVKKKRRVITGLSMLPAKTPSKGNTPRQGTIPEADGAVTVSKAAPTPPEGVPIQPSSVGRLPPPVISLESDEVGEGVPTYYGDPPAFNFDPTQSPITPENGVEFLCSYGKNMLRSKESTIFGKMSTADRI